MIVQSCEVQDIPEYEMTIPRRIYNAIYVDTSTTNELDTDNNHYSRRTPTHYALAAGDFPAARISALNMAFVRFGLSR
jgi:hypothetical protein